MKKIVGNFFWCHFNFQGCKKCNMQWEFVSNSICCSAYVRVSNFQHQLHLSGEPYKKRFLTVNICPKVGAYSDKGSGKMGLTHTAAFSTSGSYRTIIITVITVNDPAGWLPRNALSLLNILALY